MGEEPRRGGKSTVLVAEDDDDDFLLTEKAFREAAFAGDVRRVRDGEELMELLRSELLAGQGAPGALLLLLDLNMPRMDGRRALVEIRSHPELRRLPVVVLTTSTAEADLVVSYELGANSFIRKPAGFDEFVALIAAVKRYWFEVVVLPPCGVAAPSR